MTTNKMNDFTFINFAHFHSPTSLMDTECFPLNDPFPSPDAQVYLLQQNEKTTNFRRILPKMYVRHLKDEYFIVLKIELPIVDVRYRNCKTIPTTSENQYDVGDRRSAPMTAQLHTINANNNVYDNN